MPSPSRPVPPVAALLVAAAALSQASPALACGGFFCQRTPVDQQAERIVFAVGPEGTTMIVQIAYTGRPEDFAWVLPVADVPDRESLGTFPAAAIQALDVNTAPVFFRPEDPECGSLLLDGGGAEESTPGVTVHIQETVGPYEVVVIEGESADALLDWLSTHDYRLGEAMRPVIEAYVGEGMKLLALRLSPGATTGDVQPFRMTLPPGPPSIPIRLTAVAAEPEMGLLVFLLADRRWGPANWSELEIDPGTLRYASYAWPAETDWLARVARDADADDGRAWVTEMAGPTAPLLEQVLASMPTDDTQRDAREALAALLGGSPYLTRLYARLSPEEMTVDPVFRPRGGDDVPRERRLARIVDGEDQCLRDAPSPCEFVTCGAGGTCTGVRADYFRSELPACRCADGTSARATVDPRGQVVPVCQRVLSFLSPAELGADPCAGVDCGPLGRCLPINAIATCDCDAGAVAIGWDREGARRVRCVDPAGTVPADLLGNPGAPVPPAPPPTPPPPPPAATPDAGAPATTPDPSTFGARGGGCGCAVARGDAPHAPGAPWLLGGAVLGLAGLRLRRRRRRVPGA